MGFGGLGIDADFRRRGGMRGLRDCGLWLGDLGLNVRGLGFRDLGESDTMV